MNQENTILIFGAGSGGQKVAEALESMGYFITAFVDNDKTKWGTQVHHGKSVIAPDDLTEQYPDALIIVASTYHLQIISQLQKLGISECSVKVAEDLIYERIDSDLEVWKRELNPVIQKEPVLMLEAVQGLGLGGIEQWTRLVARELLCSGNPFLMVTTQEELKKENPLKETMIGFDFSEEAYRASVCDLVHFLSSHLPCTILLNRINQVFMAAHIVKKYYPDKVHMIYVMHNDFERFYHHCRLAADDVDRFVCVSSRICRKLKENYHVDKQVVFFKSPVILDYEYRKIPNKEEPVRIGYAARIEKGQKRCELLIPLLHRLNEKKIPYYMEIAGDGSYFPKLKEALEQIGTSETVRLLGQLDEGQMKEFWKRQDISISVSDLEGCALTMLESMSYAVVPVMTRVSGTEDFIVDGENGFLVELEDIDKMAEIIGLLENDREQLERAGLLCQSRILKECQPEQYVMKLVRMINEIEQSNGEMKWQE